MRILADPYHLPRKYIKEKKRMKTFIVDVTLEVEAVDNEAAEDLVLDILNAEAAFKDVEIGTISEAIAVG